MLRGIADVAGGYLCARASQSLYLTVTVTVAVVALLNLAALNPPIADDSAHPTSIFASNPTGGRIPMRYADRLSSLPGFSGATYLNGMALACGGNVTASINGNGGPATAFMLRDSYAIDDATIAAWNADPLGLLVGKTLAQRCGWSAGMHLKPRDPELNRDVEIHIVAVLDGRPDTPYVDQIAIAHYEYLNRLAFSGDQDQSMGIVAYARTPGEAPALAAAIEAMFAHDDPPVETQLSNEASDNLRRFGKVQAILDWVMAAVLACVGLVVVSLGAHSAAERRRHFAVLRVLGLHRRFLFAAFACEFALLVATGLAAGICLGLLVNRWLNPAVSAITGSFVLPGWIWRFLVLAFLAVLLLSLAIPARVIARTRPIDYR